MAKRSVNQFFLFSLAVIIFVLCFFVFNVKDHLRNLGSSNKFPDFSHYHTFTHTLSNSQFPTDDTDRRIAVIGDLHGMNETLTDLLNKISYDARKDTLIHLGDLVTKAPVDDSLAVLSFMASNKVLGVRGNNDQVVLEWRAWMDWMVSQPGGREWLTEADKHWSDYEAAANKSDMSAFDSHTPLMNKHDWGSKVPEGWKPLGAHYRVARAMSREHYEYLRSLPLVLYAPAGHVFFVHAGLLAADPRRKTTHPKQPLSHWPLIEQNKNSNNIPALREAQELSLLSEIPQNQDPWVVQNIRSVRRNGKVSRSNNKGTPFSDLWNEIMDQCSGLDASDGRLASIPRLTGDYMSQVTHLPCYASTVVYGHAAIRGLDIKRWSVGLDTGCAYGRRLSALVLDAGSFSSGASQHHISDFPSESTDQDSPRIRFGHAGEAHIVSVKCH